MYLLRSISKREPPKVVAIFNSEKKLNDYVEWSILKECIDGTYVFRGNSILRMSINYEVEYLNVPIDPMARA